MAHSLLPVQPHICGWARRAGLEARSTGVPPIVLTPSQYLEGAGQLGTQGGKAQGAGRAGSNSPEQKLTGPALPRIGSPRGAHHTQAGAARTSVCSTSDNPGSLGPRAAADGQCPPGPQALSWGTRPGTPKARLWPSLRATAGGAADVNYETNRWAPVGGLGRWGPPVTRQDLAALRGSAPAPRQLPSACLNLVKPGNARGVSRGWPSPRGPEPAQAAQVGEARGPSSHLPACPHMGTVVGALSSSPPLERAVGRHLWTAPSLCPLHVRPGGRMEWTRHHGRRAAGWGLGSGRAAAPTSTEARAWSQGSGGAPTRTHPDPWHGGGVRRGTPPCWRGSDQAWPPQCPGKQHMHPPPGPATTPEATADECTKGQAPGFSQASGHRPAGWVSARRPRSSPTCPGAQRLPGSGPGRGTVSPTLRLGS